MSKKHQFWDCPCCGTKGIQRRHRACPQCNAERAKGMAFYGLERVHEADVERMRLSESGVKEWICPYCGKPNPVAAGICTHCEGKREEKPRYRIVKPAKGDEAPRRKRVLGWVKENNRDHGSDSRSSPPAAPPPLIRPASSPARIFKKAASGCAFVIGLILILWLVYRLSVKFFLPNME